MDIKNLEESVSNFFDQFKPIDSYTRLVLEIFFEEIYGEKTNNEEDLSIPRQEGQERDKNS